MTTIANLEPAQLAVEPGRSVTTTLNLRNAGDIVHGYRFEVLGDPAPWVHVEPDTLTLYPGTSGSVTLSVAPPRDARTPTGAHPFGVHVLPVDAPAEAVVPEATVTVSPFQDITVELVPKTSQGSGKGRHDVAIDNRGNVPVTMRVTGADPNQDLTFSDPDQVYVPAGQTAFGRIGVKPAHRLWRGQARTLPFVVHAAGEDGPPQTVDGARVQTAMLPKWLGWLLAALVALAALLVALWFALVKPAVQADARDAAAKAAAPASSAASSAAAAASQAAAAASQAGSGGGGGGSSSAPVTSPTSGTSPSASQNAPAPVPTSQHLALSTAPGGSASNSFAVPGHKTFDVTGLTFENPQLDLGTMNLSLRLANGTPDQLLIGPIDLQNIGDNDDYHFASPIVVGPGDQLVLSVNCAKVGTPVAQPHPSTCGESLLINGTMTTP